MEIDDVICNARYRCREASMCGGAKPHRHDPSECGKCSFIKGAECVQVTEEDDK